MNYKIPKPTKEQLSKDFYSNLTWAEIASKYGYKDSKSVRVFAKEYGLPNRRIYLKPTKGELEKLLFVDKLNPRQIADKLGYVNGTCQILSYMREYGLKADFHGYYELREIPMSQEQKSIIYGTLLGDGYLRPNIHSYGLAVSHSNKQSEYVKWKKEKLSPFVIMDIREDSNYKGFGGKTSTLLSFNTVSHPFYNEFHDELYVNKIKTISFQYLTHIDELALAVWFMDDGSLNKRYGTMSLATDCFSYDEHLILQQWFYERWNLKVMIEPKKRRDGNYVFNVRFNAATSARQLRNILSPFIPSCMDYKIKFKG
jgi:hypothetical protein